MDIEKMREALGRHLEPVEGLVYFNPHRGNCLRIIGVGKELVHCLSFRPDGERGSAKLWMKKESLRTYFPVGLITVETPFGKYQWSSIPKKGRWAPE